MPYSYGLCEVYVLKNNKMNEVVAALKARYEEITRKILSATGYIPVTRYFHALEDNLLPGVRYESFVEDLLQGDGGELQCKFMAVHSSSALAVNCFAPFRDGPSVPLPDIGRYTVRQFEKRLPIFKRGGRDANLDVWLEDGDAVLAVESKFTEYFIDDASRRFNTRYAEEEIRDMADPAWYAVYQEIESGSKPFIYLDAVQLVRHSFALARFAAENPGKKLSLLYLYWEPKNAEEIEVCLLHREEIHALEQKVADARLIRFHALSYPGLWQMWHTEPALQTHAARLTEQYQVVV